MAVVKVGQWSESLSQGALPDMLKTGLARAKATKLVLGLAVTPA
jgi:hypothetical protein